MINPLSRLSPLHVSRLSRYALEPTPPAVSDSAGVAPRERHRPPTAAIDFMAGFNKQLGLSDAMVAEKNALMAESSHAFFRAAPALFHHDLQTTYREAAQLLPEPAPTVRVLGDAHALNAGTFRGPAGETVWGLNDFDQAGFGSPEADLERLGVSLYVAARSKGETAETAARLVEVMACSYLQALGEPGPSYLTSGEASGAIRKLIEKKGSKSQTEFLQKWTANGRLLRNESLVEPDPARGAEITASLKAAFPDLVFHDLASKPHSGGSTRGLERYYALVSTAAGGDPWILETKAVLPSPVERPDGDLSRGDGAKVLEFQRFMGGVVDGRHRHFKLSGTAFFTREREREKGSLKENPQHLEESAVSVGRLLARAHSRSGADLSGWVGGREEEFTRNLVDFSRRYARQVESDFREWASRHGAGKRTEGAAG